jgi:hypothetical protein
LLADALRMGLVDECDLFLSPIIVGGGLPALPDNVGWDLKCWMSTASATA